MAHFLVDQLRFSRGELQRCLDGISDEDARRRIMPMNCISWSIGHLANQEQFFWVWIAQGKVVVPGLYERVGTGQPASTPPLDEMWEVWRAITTAADDYLERLTPELMTTYFEYEGKPVQESIGTLLLRNIHHYWFHIGEAYAVRQLLGHADLPEFVGDMSAAGYRPE